MGNAGRGEGRRRDATRRVATRRDTMGELTQYFSGRSSLPGWDRVDQKEKEIPVARGGRPLCALDGCSLLKGLGGGSSSTRFFMKARASAARNSRLLTVGRATQHPLFNFLDLKHRMSQTLPIQADRAIKSDSIRSCGFLVLRSFLRTFVFDEGRKSQVNEIHHIYFALPRCVNCFLSFRQIIYLSS